MRTLFLLSLTACSPPTAPVAPSPPTGGIPSEGDADTDADADADADADMDADVDIDVFEHIRAVDGTSCPAHTRIGTVVLTEGLATLDLWDRPDPLLTPALDDASCSLTDRAPGCQDLQCGAGTTCGVDATTQQLACVPERQRISGVTFTAGSGAVTVTNMTVHPDGVWRATLPPETYGRSLSASIRLPGERTLSHRHPLPVAIDATLDGLVCSDGDLDLSWPPLTSGEELRFAVDQELSSTTCFFDGTTGSATVPSGFTPDEAPCEEAHDVVPVRRASFTLSAGCVDFLWVPPT